MDIFLILLAIVVVLVIDYFIAKEFYNIAIEKGYKSQKYLWLPFLLGLVGYLLVIALPDRKHSKNNYTSQFKSESVQKQNSMNADSQYGDLPEL